MVVLYWLIKLNLTVTLKAVIIHKEAALANKSIPQ